MTTPVLTLRESIQVQINAAQDTVNKLTEQLNSADKGMSALLSSDVETVKAFFVIFGDFLK